MEFCKAFNAATQKLEAGMPIPVTITVFQDKSFIFETKQPPVSFFIKKALKLKKASKTPGKETIASLSKNDVEALAKLPSLNELRGKIVGLLQAPATKIARLTKEPASKVLITISQKSKQ